MEWGNFVSWVISRALFRYQSMFLSSLSKSAGSSELRHKFQAQPHACLSPSTFCCRRLERRISWILTGSREGCCEGWLPTKGMEKFPSSSEKNYFLLLFELRWKEGRLSWAAAEGGFDEDQCCWGAAGVLSAAGL